MSDAPFGIFNTVKKLLGLDPTMNDDFDTDILIGINSAFFTLQQLKVGPENGFMITGTDETWGDFFSGDPNNKQLQAVKMYVYLKTRLSFDPPENSFGLTAIQDQLKELEWRLNVQVDHTPLSDPVKGVDDVFANTVAL